MSLEYDISLIRHEEIIAIKELLELQPGKRALVKLESGKEVLDMARLRSYERNLIANLGKNNGDYNRETGLINDKWGLVVERK